MYVLRRSSDSWFVSSADLNPTGGSYSPTLQCAKVYPTRDAARADACGNESVYSVAEILHAGY